MSYEQALSVSQLNEYVKALIDSDELLQTAVVCGEISNFKNHYSTLLYQFSISISAYMRLIALRYASILDMITSLLMPLPR